MKRKLLFLFLSAIYALAVNADSKNGIVYVKLGATGTGTSWSDALGDIQSAITKAIETPAEPRDVWVAGGEYSITTTIPLVNNVSIYGSFAGTEGSIDERAKVANGKSWEFVNATTLKGTLVSSPATTQRIFEATANYTNETIIDGFILTESSGAGNTVFPNSAGAILMRNNTTLQNSILKGNNCTSGLSTQGNGGAVNMVGGTIRACYFVDNIAKSGGAIYINTLVPNTTTISDCIFENNEANSSGGGGAIRSQGKANTNISRVIIQNNKSGTYGGGAIYSNSSTVRISNSVIANNTGANVIYLNGGNLANCTIANNVGGIYCPGSGVNFTNNVVWGCINNLTDASATAISAPEKTTSGAVITDRTFNNNATYISIPDYLTKGNNILLPSNNSNGEVPEATTEIKYGPKFASPTSFKGCASDAAQVDLIRAAKWNILVGSPLIDKGTDVAESTDIIGTARTAGAFDIGAYEYTASPSTGIEDITTNNVSIYAVGRTVYVNNTDGMRCYLYNIVGQQVKEINPNEQSFTVEQAGTYIVRCGNKSSKIIITQ